MGVSRDEMGRVRDGWPESADWQVQDAAVNNALNNLLGYPHNKWDEWERFISVKPAVVQEIFRRWRGIKEPNEH